MMSRIPTTAGARRTRERVLESALELFNERGCASVTTNHVAAHAGISPGNLYYWFGDKDEIVRELYAQFLAGYEQLWAAGAGQLYGLSPDEVMVRLAEGAALSGRYAFLSRDLFGLLHGDPALAASYRAVYHRRIAEFTSLAHAWRVGGLIRDLDDDTIADLVDALWVISETWLAFAEIDGAHAEAEHGARLLRVVLKPYLTAEGARW
jgi:AcrR family transcriptional regulator